MRRRRKATLWPIHISKGISYFQANSRFPFHQGQSSLSATMSPAYVDANQTFSPSGPIRIDFSTLLLAKEEHRSCEV